MDIALLNAFSSAWALCLWQASWQGGLALLVVWLLTVAVRRVPAQMSCWLWRLAFLKLLIAAVWIVPIELRWLPPVAVQAVARPQVVNVTRPRRVIEPVGEAVEHPPSVVITPTLSTITRTASPVVALRLSGWSWLLIAWSIGVVVCLVNLLRQWLIVRQMLRMLTPVNDEVVRRSVEHVCRRLGIRKPPAMCVSQSAGAPCLIGIMRPVIVLPAAVLESCSPDALNAALTHEIAHVKRQDLFWNWLPALAEVFFYFHPLVWLTKREWRLAQEIATDELAVTASQFDPARYAGFLVELVAKCRPSAIRAPLAVGVSETYTQLSRRMAAMLAFREFTLRRRMIAAVVIVAIATAGLVPWKLTAREAQAAPPSPAPRVPAKSPEAVVAAIEKLGGDVTYDQKNPQRVVIAVNLFQKSVTDADLVDLKVFTGLRAVTLDVSKVTGAGLAHLKDITTLQAVDLNETGVTDAGLAYLAGLPKLEQLGLIGTPITDQGLKHLRDLRQMSMLLLGRTKITDQGLVHLKGFSKLKTLALDGTRITDAGLEHLKGLTELLDLRLNATQITDAGLQHLQPLTKLQTLEISQTKVTDAGLSHLSQLQSLQTLWLIQAHVTDAGLKHLKGLSNLRSLNLEGNKSLTDKAVQELRKALPKCKIEWTAAVTTNTTATNTAPQSGDQNPKEVPIIPPPPDPRLLKLPFDQQICELLPPIWARRLDDSPGYRKGAQRPLILDNRKVLCWEQILDLQSGERISQFAFGQDELVRAPLSITANRQFLLVERSPKRNNSFQFDFTTWLQVWDVGSQKMLGASIAPPDQRWQLNNADMTADGKFVAIANEKAGEVSVWNVANGQHVKNMPVNLDRFAKGYEGRAPFFTPEFLRFSHDNKWLVTFTPNRGLYWKWQTDEEPTVIELGRRLETFAFSPDSRYLAEGPGPRTDIEIRDMETLKVVQRVDDGAKMGMITSGLTFTPDGATLIASNDATVDENKLKIPHRLHFWDVSTGKLIRQLAMPIYRPRYLDLSPNGRYLIVFLESNSESALAVWDLQTLLKQPPPAN